jgi:hypothetical protein
LGFLDLFKKHKATANTSDFSLRRELLEKIEIEWHRVFEWRLGQLLSNALSENNAYPRRGLEMRELSDEEWMNVFFSYSNKEKHVYLHPEVMRDPARIPHIMQNIRDYWKAHPDLTFSQIIVGTIEKHQAGSKLVSASDKIWHTLVQS